MASSENASTPKGCFSSILSRLLCSGSLPTHPSDHLPQLTSNESTHQPKGPITESKPIVGPSSTPLVARLMGLDPFPNTNSFPQRRTLDSILRSKSVNYVDFYLPNLDFPKQAQDKAQQEAHDQARHRRVKTSVSFRDVGPTFLDPQNHDLLILCLDQVDEISRKSELRWKEMVREKNKKSSKLKEEKPKKVINGPRPKPKVGNVFDLKGDVCAKARATLDRKSPVSPTVSIKEECVRKKRENGNKSRNSRVKSPCVVYQDFPMRVEAQMPDNPGAISNKATFLPRFDKYDDHPCPNFTSRLKEDVHQELRTMKSKNTNKPSKIKKGNNLVDMLIEVCRLTEEDTKKGSIWMAGNDLKLEKIEEICFEFEQEALEMLLSQLVDELCDSSQNLGLNLS